MTTEQLTLQLPFGLDAAVREVLRATPGVSFSEKNGLTETSFVVTGTAEALAALAPRIEAEKRDYVSREAW